MHGRTPASVSRVAPSADPPQQEQREAGGSTNGDVRADVADLAKTLLQIPAKKVRCTSHLAGLAQHCLVEHPAGNITASQLSLLQLDTCLESRGWHVCMSAANADRQSCMSCWAGMCHRPMYIMWPRHWACILYCIIELELA